MDHAADTDTFNSPDTSDSPDTSGRPVAVERVQDFPVPAAALWSAVSDAEQLALWLGDGLELDVRPGGTGRVVEDGEVRRVVVEDVVDGERLAFTWWAEHADERRPGSTLAGPPTCVELLVQATATGSRLIVRESAPHSTRWALHLCVLGLHCAAGALGLHRAAGALV